ncbi:hypothetical protein [Jeotgalibaca ciconiae]|uniref:YbjN domain-containing protein n=1 Tax=Jeotgalibaca ciconiae TaxID=2496265 RepID=A0A3S9HD21_9LACT|nr:hypothetical protein [Jeotgalibaca ciconiae]AZP05227.1 hypothetical protein EJN90_11575 [Jeotgalibaca ciconiae]HJB23480.1 hypothetical protein [Candidatus Jeotgalibaca pullicola]
MQILEELDKLFAEKKLPLKRQEIVNNQTLYQGSFLVRPGKKVPFGIVIVNGEGVVDFQITFKQIGYLTNYNDKAKLLEVINELNLGKAFYYKVSLAGDGEILMRTMAKTTEDVRPLYEMLIVGSNVVKQVIQEVEKIAPPVE